MPSYPLYPIRAFFKEKLVLASVVLFFLSNSALWMYLLYNAEPRDHFFLHYTVYFGVDLVGTRNDAFLLPAGGLLIGVVNTLLAYLFRLRARPLSVFFLVLTLVTHVFLGVAVVLVASLNLA